MSGAIPPLPNMPSWCGAQLKHRDSFTFAFYWLIYPFFIRGVLKIKRIKINCLFIVTVLRVDRKKREKIV
jgi:hypothetical protein